MESVMESSIGLPSPQGAMASTERFGNSQARKIAIRLARASVRIKQTT